MKKWCCKVLINVTQTGIETSGKIKIWVKPRHATWHVRKSENKLVNSL